MVVGISKGQHRARTRLSPNALARFGLSDYQADDRSRGEVAEWSNVAVSKTVEGASLPRVRIPVSPPSLHYSVFSMPYGNSLTIIDLLH
jgi:hypothetical protein